LLIIKLRPLNTRTLYTVWTRNIINWTAGWAVIFWLPLTDTQPVWGSLPEGHTTLRLLVPQVNRLVISSSVPQIPGKEKNGKRYWNAHIISAC